MLPIPAKARRFSRIGALHATVQGVHRSEEHTSELQSLRHLVCRLLLEKKKKKNNYHIKPTHKKNNNTNITHTKLTEPRTLPVTHTDTRHTTSTELRHRPYDTPQTNDN